VNGELFRAAFENLENTREPSRISKTLRIGRRRPTALRSLLHFTSQRYNAHAKPPPQL